MADTRVGSVRCHHLRRQDHLIYQFQAVRRVRDGQAEAAGWQYSFTSCRYLWSKHPGRRAQLKSTYPPIHNVQTRLWRGSPAQGHERRREARGITRPTVSTTAA